MNYIASFAAILVAHTAVAQEGKWVWSSGRNAPSYPDQFAGAASFPDQFARPSYRPTGGGRYRPPAPVFENTDLPNRPSRPGGQAILTGPVPSWEQRPEDKLAYKDYRHCKCDYGFNCKSPGIKFGQCDADKQYCCFNEKPGLQNGGGGPPFNNRGPENVYPPINNNRGPQNIFTPVNNIGGPENIYNNNNYNNNNNRGPGNGYRPPYDRPVLVGPGGPTGIVTEGGRPFRPPIEEQGSQSRPPYYSYGTFNDENFPRPPYDPFSRSANLEAKKNGKKL